MKSVSFYTLGHTLIFFTFRLFSLGLLCAICCLLCNKFVLLFLQKLALCLVFFICVVVAQKVPQSLLVLIEIELLQCCENILRHHFAFLFTLGNISSSVEMIKSNSATIDTKMKQNTYVD